MKAFVGLFVRACPSVLFATLLMACSTGSVESSLVDKEDGGGGSGGSEGQNAGGEAAAGGEDSGIGGSSSGGQGAVVDAAVPISTPDAAASAGDGGADDGVCPGLMCEDFESGSITAPTWAAYSNPKTNTVEVTMTLPGGKAPAHGKYALHVKNRSGQAVIRSERVPASLHRHQFGRFYFFLVSNAPNHHTAIQWSSVAKGWPYSDTHYEVNLQSKDTGVAWWDVGGQYGGGEGAPGQGTATLPRNRWVCIEWEYDDTTMKQTLWIDGVQKISGTNRIRNKAPWALSQVGIGWRLYVGQSNDMDAYIDDIVLGERRIGCFSTPP